MFCFSELVRARSHGFSSSNKLRAKSNNFCLTWLQQCSGGGGHNSAVIKKLAARQQWAGPRLFVFVESMTALFNVASLLARTNTPVGRHVREFFPYTCNVLTVFVVFFTPRWIHPCAAIHFRSINLTPAHTKNVQRIQTEVVVRLLSRR